MSIPRNDILIKKARTRSLNKEHSDLYGIDDEFFIDALGDAVFELQKYLIEEASEPFATYQDITITSPLEAYEVPKTCFATNMVYDVFYSGTGDEKGFFDPLTRGYKRRFYDTGYPEEVFIDGGRIYLYPNPIVGKIRLRYERKLDFPDLRRGKVLSSTILSGTTLTQLQADITSVENEERLQDAEYLCINDSHGMVKMRNIKVSGYDQTTGEFTISGGGFLFETGESLSVGDYITTGCDSTTHIKLPDFCESYFIEFLRNEVLLAQSSMDTSESNPKLLSILSNISKIYAQLPCGRAPIPELRGGY